MFNSTINKIPKTSVGKRSISNLRKIKQEKILIISSKTMEKNGFLEKIKEQLQNKNISYIYPKENTLEELNRISEELDKPEIILSVGGGNIIDFSKLLRIKIDNPGLDLSILNNVTAVNKNTSLIVIPTTPSTGSQVTPVAITLDKEKNEKKIFLNEANIPEEIILYPQFLSTINEKQMAEFICDIFAHSTESYFSRLTNNFIQNLAEMNIRELIENWKEYCKKEKDNLETLNKIAMNGQIGGICQGNAYVGVMHAIAHQVETLTGIGHSKVLLNIIPSCLEWYFKKTDEKMYTKFLDYFNKLNLNEYFEDVFLGLNQKELISKTLKDPSIKTSPIIFNEETTREIIQWISTKK